MHAYCIHIPCNVHTHTKYMHARLWYEMKRKCNFKLWSLDKLIRLFCLIPVNLFFSSAWNDNTVLINFYPIHVHTNEQYQIDFFFAVSMDYFFVCDDCCRFSTVYVLLFLFFSILFLIAFAVASLFLFSLALVWLFNTLCLCCFAVVYDDFQDKCYSRSVKIKKWRYRKTHTGARVSTYFRSWCLAFESSDACDVCGVCVFVCLCLYSL